MGGPNVFWNMVVLSYEDHTTAHELLFECYGNLFDKAVWKMRSGLTSEARSNIAQANIVKARENKTGRFSSELQSKLGSLPKKPRKPFAKKECVMGALEKGMVWIHVDGTKYNIKGNELQSPSQVAELLSTKCSAQMCDSFKEKGPKSYLYGGIIKILNGWRDAKTNKALYSVGPWRLEGLLI